MSVDPRTGWYGRGVITVSSRRRAAWVAVPLASVLAVAGCSAKPAASPSGGPASSPAPATTSKAAPAMTISNAPADLVATMTQLYAGGEVPSSGAATAALKARRPAAPPAAAAGTGTWAGTPVAVVQAGKDVTLLVKARGTWTVVGGWWPTLGITRSTLTQKRFLTLLGSDQRADGSIRGARADAIHVVGFDGGTRAGVLGVARDSWVTLPNGSKGKINAAMGMGGPDAQVATLARVSGIALHDWMVIDFEAFKGLVNDVGGLTLDLPPQARKAGLPTGTQQLDGAAVLRWARERKGLAAGDFDRSHNQGLILVAGAVVLRGKGPTALPRYLGTVNKYVTTNLTAEQALTFFASVYQIDPGQVGMGVAAGSGGTGPGGASIVVPGAKEAALYADLRDGNLTKR